MNNSARTLKINSTKHNPGPCLQAQKLQGQHVQDLKSELTPGTNSLGVAAIGCNPRPQGKCVIFFF